MNRVDQIKRYLSDVQTELKRVVWPTRKETTTTTVVVLTMVFLVSLFLWLVDTLLALIVKLVIH